MISMMEPRPPYVRFEVQTASYRDLNGVSHSRDVERILVTPAGSKDTFVGDAADWIRNKEILSQQEPPGFPPPWIERIRARYDQWKRGIEIPEEGTPIRGWPVLTASEIKRCIDANILTVEDLAQATEQGLQNLGMGARGMKDRAVKWLEEKNGTGRLAEENEALRQSVTQLTETVSEQGRQLQVAMSTISAMNANQPQQASGKRRGRPGPAPEPLDDGDVIR